MTAAPVLVYVISLARATRRRQQIAQEFARLGYDYTIFDGVDGQADLDALMPNADVAAWRRNMGADISAGHLGCYASHLRLWTQIGMHGPDMALICEDDVAFDPAFPDALAEGLAAQSDWDILRFAKIRAKGPITQRHLGDYRLNAYWGPFTGNACYLIKRHVARDLAARFGPIRRAHDHELNRFFVYDIRLMGLEPFAAHPMDQGESYITGTAMAGQSKFPKYRRLPHYAQKALNYFRRIWWLGRRGMLWPKH